MKRTTRRRFIASGAAVGAITIAGCADEDPEPEPEETPEDDETPTETEEEEADVFEAGYEIWAADQGTDTVYIYEPADDSGEEYDLLDEIDTGAEGGHVPHMADYSSDYEYVAIPCTTGARTLIYRAEDRELVANLETGAGSHFAGFGPNDEYIHVDVIGESEIVRVDVDLENEEFEIVDEIEVLEDETVQEAGIESGSPICHSYDKSGRSIHTMGPAYDDGSLVIVDHEEFEVDTAFPHEELPTNCGTMPHVTEDTFYLTAGNPTPTDDDGNVIEEQEDEAVGEYYVLDTENDEVIHNESTRGVDAHGFWFTPDGEELWVLNRETNDGVVVDPDTHEVVDEIDAFGPATAPDPDERDAPDIFWGSPDGEYMFVTLRGPEPQSGDPHAATGVNPGFAVIDTDTHDIVTTVQPDPDNDESDLHGIGVRPTREYDGFNLPPF
ncbi:probable secreted glycoprotein [Natronomonas pharaonis DSM 2160]|uniref:Probable secreted glycoprotein n=1 Tax=Natronomonas pharaonis (strain ATCC 35678 / DSM 2160 / CIP 103997 / JCM 8858 / NBRC 14720 / NCIMB 2260 / Gabara) TaxID=348780 RepID=A0A1U7EWZ1_NATPD|nr:hypothetical protein [Natronomonas pharaonis]CAI49607.1 probable secreted glycoprotein [Natronomonas pharaonis DSM 2160]